MNEVLVLCQACVIQVPFCSSECKGYFMPVYRDGELRPRETQSLSNMDGIQDLKEPVAFHSTQPEGRFGDALLLGSREMRGSKYQLRAKFKQRKLSLWDPETLKASPVLWASELP